MKANIEVGGNQLIMDQKPRATNGPHLEFFLSFSLSYMMKAKGRLTLQVKLNLVFVPSWSPCGKMSYWVIFQII